MVKRLRRQFNPATGAKCLGHTGRTLCFNADNLDLWTKRFDVTRDACDETAAAYRNEYRSDRATHLAQYFHTDRTLSGNNVLVIKGRDQGQSSFSSQLGRMSRGRIIILTNKFDLGASRLDRIALDRGRVDTHDDSDGNVQRLSSKRHALGVIAG